MFTKIPPPHITSLDMVIRVPNFYTRLENDTFAVILKKKSKYFGQPVIISCHRPNLVEMEYLRDTEVLLVHEEIINSVVEKSLRLFLEEGIENDVLQKLGKVWKRKISERNVLPVTSPITPSLPPRKRNTRKKPTFVQLTVSVRAQKQCNQKCLASTAPLSASLCEDGKTDQNLCRSMPILTSDSEEDEKTTLTHINRTGGLIAKVKKEPFPIGQSLSTVEEDLQKRAFVNQLQLLPGPSTSITVPEIQQANQIKLHSEPRPSTSNKQVIPPLYQKIINKVAQVKLNRLADLIPEVKTEKTLANEGSFAELQKQKQAIQYKLHSVLESDMYSKQVEINRLVDRIPKIQEEISVEACSPVTEPESQKQAGQSKLQLVPQSYTSSMQQVLSKYKNIFNKTPVIKIHRLIYESIEIQEGGTAEANNNVVKKRGRGRPKRKHQPFTKPVKKRGRGGPKREKRVVIEPVIKPKKGRPKHVNGVLKPNVIQQHITPQPNETMNKTNPQEFKKTNCNQPTMMQCNGASGNPKFSLKAKFTGTPVKVNRRPCGEAQLDSSDDLTDDEASLQPFECENVIICQYENVKRTKNKWKISLKCGMMHLNGKDYVFKTATSSAVGW